MSGVRGPPRAAPPGAESLRERTYSQGWLGVVLYAVTVLSTASVDEIACPRDCRQ